MIRFLKYTFVFLFAVIWANRFFSFESSANKPLKYLTHKKSINKLLMKFDSITPSCFLSIGKTMNKMSVHICFNNNSKFVDKIVTRHPDSIKAISQDLGINYEKMSEVISLLFETKINSIKAISIDKVKRIELFMYYHFFSENGKGLVYFPDQHKDQKLNIEKFIYPDRHISF